MLTWVLISATFRASPTAGSPGSPRVWHGGNLWLLTPVRNCIWSCSGVNDSSEVSTLNSLTCSTRKETCCCINRGLSSDVWSLPDPPSAARAARGCGRGRSRLRFQPQSENTKGEEQAGDQQAGDRGGRVWKLSWRVMVKACPRLHRPGRAVCPDTGLGSSPALSWAARSRELLQVFSKNSTDWAAAGVTGSLSQAGHPGQAG